jgi:7,8-dihydropterin-6-yl-methyl-4-(beta-D-ribofuranosyl)aminobenzene 5'-phosphate synthase
MEKERSLKMKDGMDRREFLKYSVAASSLLMTTGGLMGATASEASNKIVEADKVTVWIVTDNYYDALRPDNAVTKRCRIVPGRSVHAEHGLSYFVETMVDGKASACMFDYGLDPIGVLNNIELLGLDLGKANAFGLSHGHFDHFMSAVDILKKNQGKIANSTPFFVGEEAFYRRYVMMPGASQPVDIGQLKKEEIENLGLKVVEVNKPTQIIPGCYFTGNIERVTAYEKAPPYLLIKRGDKPEPDDFRGEQALFFNLKGKGLVVLSGCAHSGIVNTIKQAQKETGIEKMHAVMGGFHLINVKPEIIQKTVADVKAMKPDYIVPTHCTGFEAIVHFRNEMPDQFTLNTAGTRYTFAA